MKTDIQTKDRGPLIKSMGEYICTALISLTLQVNTRAYLPKYVKPKPTDLASISQILIQNLMDLSMMLTSKCPKLIGHEGLKYTILFAFIFLRLTPSISSIIQKITNTYKTLNTHHSNNQQEMNDYQIIKIIYL